MCNVHIPSIPESEPLSGDFLFTADGESVPVSARKLKETRTAFTNYVGDNYDDMDDILSATDTIIN